MSVSRKEKHARTPLFLACAAVAVVRTAEKSKYEALLLADTKDWSELVKSQEEAYGKHERELVNVQHAAKLAEGDTGALQAQLKTLELRYCSGMGLPGLLALARSCAWRRRGVRCAPP